MASIERDLELRVALSFRCSNLPRKDILSKSDPYVELSEYDQNASVKRWIALGRTETLQNNHNPVFTKQIEMGYRFEEEQNLLLRVFDDDYGTKTDDFLGEAFCTLGQIMGARGQILRLKLVDSKGRETSGSVTVSAEQSPTTAAGRGFLHLKLVGRNLDRKDGWFRKSDPFFVIQSSPTGLDTDYVNVYKSEYITQNLNPEWKEARVKAARLVSGRKLRLEVSDQDATKTDLIGYADITLDDLKQCRHNIPLIHPPTKSKYTKASYVNSGLVDVISCRTEERYTMIDYLRGGLQIQLSVAVDFTASNGDPQNVRALHYGMGNCRNPYVDAIVGVGNILMHYDWDKLVPAYGFGARPDPQIATVSHCFPLKFGQEDPMCHGVDGVLEAYRETFKRGVVLSGPTHFSEVIRNAARQAEESSRPGNALSYSVLLLLTDGVINDMDATVDAICDAARLPMSIIIVGVGNANFAAMEALDADVNPLVDAHGQPAVRDIVQFVPFNKFQNDARLLAKETLAELPDQIAEYFGERRIPPGRPIFVEPQESMRFARDPDIPTAVAVDEQLGRGSVPVATASIGKTLLNKAYAEDKKY